MRVPMKIDAQIRPGLGLLPLPEGERGGVRGFGSLDKLEPLTRPRLRAGDLSPSGRGELAAPLYVNFIRTRTSAVARSRVAAGIGTRAQRTR
jgi:hypothetical protein